MLQGSLCDVLRCRGLQPAKPLPVEGLASDARLLGSQAGNFRRAIFSIDFRPL